MRLFSILFFVIFWFSSTPGYAQNTHIITITVDKLNLEKGGFYVDKVQDVRENKADIGFVQKGFFNKKVRADLSGGILFTLKSFFNYNLYKTEGNTPLVVKINKFEVSEVTDFSAEYAIAEVTLSYYYDSVFLYRSVQTVRTRGLDVTKLHSANIETALYKSLRHFDRFDWEARVNGASSDTEIINEIATSEIASTPRIGDLYTPEFETHDKSGEKKRNATTLGYQIGGFTLVGLDYEVRVSDYFGIHFGGGFAGYTAGLKVHTNDEKSSPFFNINYKDGGFGLIETAGIEYGARLPFSKKRDFGLHFQAGIGKILSVDPAFSLRVFNAVEAPNYMLTLGVGFGW